MNWQTIDTAPKDGTAIILYCGKQWDTSPIANIEEGSASAFIVAGFLDGAWFLGSVYAPDGLRYIWPLHEDVHPTHWMPLPHPPA